MSVVIPAYNAGRYIAEALASVRAQSRQPAEILVVDDGSTDATATIAQGAGARVIRQANGGASRARNAGIRAATAPWIAFLDADDRWEATRLAAQWALHETRPDVSLLATDYRMLAEGTLRGGAVMASLPQYRAMRRTALGAGSFAPRAEVLAAILEANFLLPSSFLVARRLFEDRGLYFTERERLPSGDEFYIGEDYEWLLRALRFTDVLFVDEPLVAYRRTPESLSSSGGRSRYGDVVLGRHVGGAPAAYAPGAAAAFRRLRPRHLREAGLRFLAAGQVGPAHRTFLEAAREGRDPRAGALAGLTFPFASRRGARGFALLFVLWRRGLRPLARRLRRPRR